MAETVRAYGTSVRSVAGHDSCACVVFVCGKASIRQEQRKRPLKQLGV